LKKHNSNSFYVKYSVFLRKFLPFFEHSIFSPKKFTKMSHNVPAVYEVLPARIRALRSKDQGWQNVPEQRRGNGA
jgi:hypothetical protein